MANNELTIWQHLKSKGYTDAGVAGLMGNLYAESGLNPKNLQNNYEKTLKYTDESYTAAVDKGIYKNFVKDSAGYGLAQWTFWSRKQALLNFAKGKKKSIGDLLTQLDFLELELNQGYLNLVKILKTTASVSEASNAVLLQFERPANSGPAVQAQRAKYGQNYYNKYAKSTSGSETMKYNSNNQPIVCLQTNSTCYKQTRKMAPVGILWHSTGANNPQIKRYVQPLTTDNNYNEMIKLLGKNQYNNDWNHIVHQAGVNAWVGELADGTVATVQSMPWDFRPWGCGSGSKGSCNNGWIQFEICEDSLNDKAYFNEIYKEACELTAYLCKLYKLNPLGTVKMNGVNVPVILSHADSHKLGFGSNHGDVQHWFSRHGKTMADVRRDVAKIMNYVQEEEEEMTQEQFNVMMNNWIAEQAKKEPSNWSAEARAWAEKNGLISGDGTGNKMYKKLLNREELVSVLYRALHRNFLD